MSSTIQKKTYTIIITPDKVDGGFVGRCDELHANSQGETYGEIMENMKEAVEVSIKNNEGITDFNMLIVHNRK